MALKTFPGFPDFRRFQGGPWINGSTTNETGGLKAGGRISSDFLTTRAPARARRDGKRAPRRERPWGPAVAADFSSAGGPWHGATCPSPACPEAATALPSGSTAQAKSLSCLAMAAYHFQPGFPPPETLCYPHSPPRLKNRTASDPCWVNRFQFPVLHVFNCMFCMVSNDHSKLQAAQLSIAEKRAISSLEMPYTVNFSSIP